MKAKSLLQRAVKETAALADVVRPHRPGVVVLIYHRVGGRSGLEIDLPTDRFAEQMEVLAASGAVRTLDEAVAELTAGGGAEEGERGDRVVVTFDDGTADFVDDAVPVVERFGVPVTLYAATSFIEEGASFPHDGAPVSWHGLGDAVSTGLVTIGSHTHTHALLDRLEPAAVADELDRSIDLIGERLGVRARHFAYPKALPGTAAADAAVRERFASAALAGTKPNPFGRTDPHRLWRSPIQVSDGDRWFRRKVAGGMALEDWLRRILNRGRYAGATT